MRRAAVDWRCRHVEVSTTAATRAHEAINFGHHARPCMRREWYEAEKKRPGPAG